MKGQRKLLNSQGHLFQCQSQRYGYFQKFFSRFLWKFLLGIPEIRAANPPGIYAGILPDISAGFPLRLSPGTLPEISVRTPSDISPLRRIPPAILFPRISIGTPQRMYPKISVGISPITPPIITLWIYTGIHLGIFMGIIVGIPAGIRPEVLSELYPEISPGISSDEIIYLQKLLSFATGSISPTIMKKSSIVF